MGPSVGDWRFGSGWGRAGQSRAAAACVVHSTAEAPAAAETCRPFLPPPALPCLQVTGVVARRSYNVQSLAVGNSEREGMSRITMVVPGSSNGSVNLIKQLNKLVHVEKVRGHTGSDCTLLTGRMDCCLLWGLECRQTPAHNQPHPATRQSAFVSTATG